MADDMSGGAMKSTINPYILTTIYGSGLMDSPNGGFLFTRGE